MNNLFVIEKPSVRIIKLAAVSLLGIFTALFLTWFMHILIESGDKRLDNTKRMVISDFIRLKRNEATHVKERLPQRPIQQQAPEMPSVNDNRMTNTDTINVTQINFAANLEFNSGALFGSSDGEYLPILKVAPIYPIRALQKEIEGYCVVTYSVTTSGQTKNIQVLEDECTSTLFHKPSIKAAEKFRYKPRVINGQAVEVNGIRNVFTYNIEG